MTNTGIVGLDAYELGWLRRLPHAHDIPGYDVVLANTAVETANPPSGAAGARTRTGAFAPFGSVLEAGTQLPGQVPCTSAILRCNPDGSELELVAWGVRNAFGLGFNRMVSGMELMVEWEASGTHAREFLGFGGKRRRYTLRGTTVVARRDGKIVHGAHFYDVDALLRQIEG